MEVLSGNQHTPNNSSPSKTSENEKTTKAVEELMERLRPLPEEVDWRSTKDKNLLSLRDEWIVRLRSLGITIKEISNIVKYQASAVSMVIWEKDTPSSYIKPSPSEQRRITVSLIKERYEREKRERDVRVQELRADFKSRSVRGDKSWHSTRHQNVIASQFQVELDSLIAEQELDARIRKIQSPFVRSMNDVITQEEESGKVEDLIIDTTYYTEKVEIEDLMRSNGTENLYFPPHSICRTGKYYA